MNPTPSNSFHLSNLGTFNTQQANLASKEEFNVWGWKRQMESAESKKGGAANTLKGTLGPASCAVNITAQPIIAGTPKTFTSDHGAKTFSSFINTQAPDWPVAFTRDAWNDIILFCNNNLKFTFENQCSMYHIFPLPIIFLDQYISLGVGKDHMSYDQIRIHVDAKANKKAQQGPLAKINITLIFTPGVYLQTVSQDKYDQLITISMGLTLKEYLHNQPEVKDSSNKSHQTSQKKRPSNSTSAGSEGSTSFKLNIPQSTKVATTTKTNSRLLSANHLTTLRSYQHPLQRSNSPPVWWFDPANKNLPLFGANTRTSVTLELDSVTMSHCNVGNINMLSGVLGCEVAVPISAAWANSTRAPIWKNVILLAIHVEPVANGLEIRDLEETLSLPSDPLFKTIRQADISVRPWRVSCHVDLSDPHPSSVSKEQFGGQILFDGSLLNVLARKHMEENSLLNYLEELQTNCQARKLLYDFQEFVAGHSGTNPLLAALVKNLEVHVLFYGFMFITL
ncbi:uncharacterized protein MELLADRAFT_60706 [Melampsora larici-populina 98AG31]|uniref:Uncharacterized protein n=1 Tax=Melampsora larici-populina (strain 98AG31 / pathotype 3-4-7) TaxID=747676 RepID=F4RC17_MELLP|nr:uncharacterized protein MELLADRAFT_60706 [Melampsora larici-populina 98AG31]EGG10201.1 hypothetical protein MELLADRAFT_60706 [Melampsora larici-populina 98AG31]